MNMSPADINREKEANYFACCLLMPREMFITEYLKCHEKIGQSVHGEKEKYGPDDLARELANIFQVPLHAAFFRIFTLQDDILDKINTWGKNMAGMGGDKLKTQILK